MEIYKSLLDTFNSLQQNEIAKYSDKWYDDRDNVYEKIQELLWLTEYIDITSDLRDYDKKGPDVTNLSSEIYVSSKTFPSLFNYKQKHQNNVETGGSDDGYGIFYRYYGNYGSSSVCLFRRLHIISELKNCELVTEDEECEKFIKFFTQLGLKICVVCDYTYDKMLQKQPGVYESNYGEPSIKLCVSSGILMKDILSGNQ